MDLAIIISIISDLTVVQEGIISDRNIAFASVHL